MCKPKAEAIKALSKNNGPKTTAYKTANDNRRNQLELPSSNFVGSPPYNIYTNRYSHNLYNGMELVMM